jgi:hypothetical protein
LPPQPTSATNIAIAIPPTIEELLPSTGEELTGKWSIIDRQGKQSVKLALF